MWLLMCNMCSIVLIDVGECFYSGCLRVLVEVENIENIF